VQIKKEITWSALSWADMAYLMRSGLTRISNGFVTVLQWLLISLVAASPLLVIAGIVFLVWRRRRNRKGLAPKQRKGKGPDAPNGPPESNP
jgi:Flp pilus assembly protein TadB